jgi:hypothetical protein
MAVKNGWQLVGLPEDLKASLQIGLARSLSTSSTVSSNDDTGLPPATPTLESAHGFQNDFKAKVRSAKAAPVLEAIAESPVAPEPQDQPERFDDGSDEEEEGHGDGEEGGIELNGNGKANESDESVPKSKVKAVPVVKWDGSDMKGQKVR